MPWLEDKFKGRRGELRAQSLTSTPPLEFVLKGAGGPIKRFNGCGLKRYLDNPVPRRFEEKESMYPFRGADIWSWPVEGEVSDCGPVQFPRELVAQGRQLYKKLNCIRCHGSKAGAGALDSSYSPIKIRLGIPLLSRSFVEHRLRFGTGKKKSLPLVYNFKWVRKGDIFVKDYEQIPQSFQMPSYKHLSKEQLKALYAYLSTSREDLKIKEEVYLEQLVSRYKVDERGALFWKEVVSKVFNKGCTHCHGNSASGEALAKDLFHSSKAHIPSFPTEGKAFQFAKIHGKIWSPAENKTGAKTHCGPSTFVRVLENRWQEWTGTSLSKGQLKARGMPLMMVPLPVETIEAFRYWSELGCPTPWGKKCKACTAKDQSYSAAGNKSSS